MTIQLKLQQVAKYRRGSFPQPYGNSEWYDGEGAMPFVQVADVEEDSMRLKESTKQKISKLAMPRSVFAPKGTVIVTLQGSIGKVAITQYDSYIDRTLGIFEDYLIEINKKYFALQLEKIFSIKKEKARGGTIKTITKEEFSDFLIPVPSLEEQTRIVEILDTFTSAIDNLKEQIAQRRKQYEYYRDQLLDLEGKEGLEMKTLGDIMQIVRGASPRPIKNYITTSKNGVNWIKIGDVSPNEKYISSTNEKITKEGAEKSRYLKPGDFILSNSMSFGRPYILKIDGCIHDGWIAMSDFDDYVLPDYLYEYLSSDIIQKYWKMKANNGGAMINLNSDIVKGTPIYIPSFEEQLRIVSILDTFEASIQNLEAQLKEREKQYEYYRNQLLTFE